MSENKFFQESLSNVISESAYAGAVRHLYELGYPPQRIQQEILYPVSLEKINRIIEEYERDKSSPKAEYKYVQDTDALGRKSFRRVYMEQGRQK